MVPTPLPPYITPSSYDPTLVGKVIPGVSVKATPACADLGTPGTDQFVPGAQHASPQHFAQGTYSLFSQVGTPGIAGQGATAQVDIPLQPPPTPTVIDSWATIVE
jgi:hypothetical protein